MFNNEKSPLEKPIQLGNVLSVYSGESNHCCCGCAGKHYYPKARREEASKNRGYAVSDDEVNDYMVRKVVKFINDHMDEAAVLDGKCVTVDFSDSRWYIAYLAESVVSS